MDKLTRKELERINRDPVLWTEHHIGQKPRWYQEQILRHPHNRIVLRCGRRLGKCIAGTQRMVDPETGKYETLDTLYQQNKSHKLLTVTDDFKVTRGESIQIEDNGVKEVFAVELKYGSEVKLTGNHPVLTVEGWKEVDLLKVGESIATPKETKVFGKKQPGVNRAKMLGYIAGGYKENLSGPALTVRDPEVARKIIGVAREEGVHLAQKSKQQYFFIDNKGEYREARTGDNRFVPKEVYEYDREHLIYFLSAFYDIACWTHADRIAEIGFSTTEKAFAREIKHLLLRLGVKINLVDREIDGRPATQAFVHLRSNILRFCETVAPYGAKDYTKVRNRALEMRGRAGALPLEVWPRIEDKRKSLKMKKKDVVGVKDERMRPKERLPLDTALRYAENMQDPWLHDLASGDIDWQEVVSITSIGEQQTYDVMVPETHNLLVEDIFVHNTWTMAAHMLWGVFTGNGGQVVGRGTRAVVATPYDNQAKLIFDQLKEFINNNDVLKSSVESMTKNPYFIQFKNGGTIKLFTAGTRSGAGGASLRGQAADSENRTFSIEKGFI